MSAGKPQTINHYNDALLEADRTICNQLRDIIDQHLPEADSKIWHGHPVWFLDGNPIVGYSKLKESVRLLFWSGQSFSTPGLAPGGTFKAADARYQALSDIDETALVAWLAEARTVQWDYKNLTKKKGRLDRLI